MSAIESQKQRVDLANSATAYVEIGGAGSLVHAVQLSWPDAVSSAAVTLETTNFTPDEAAYNVAAGCLWFPETTVTVVGPTAAAIGCSMLHLGNIGSKRARLKIVAAAATIIDIIPHGKTG